MGSGRKTTEPAAFLPLRPVEYQIMVSLADGDRHGWAILQDARERGEGSAVPGLATLYRALERMEAAGLIEAIDPPGGGREDERRRTFRLTRLGRAVASAETERLWLLVRAIRGSGLYGGGA